jgi:hypothetical protein
MNKNLALPRLPVENWQQSHEEWIGEVRQLIQNARAWAEKRDWAVKQDQKIITEEIFGTYEAPLLLIHTPQGRLLFEPIARYVLGAEGRFDFCVMPSYDSIPLVKTDDGWEFYSTARKDLSLPWSEKAFETVALELLKMQ